MGCANIPVPEDVFVATDQRPLELLGGGLVGVTAVMPFFLDGAEELSSIMVGGDDYREKLDVIKDVDRNAYLRQHRRQRRSPPPRTWLLLRSEMDKICRRK